MINANKYTEIFTVTPSHPHTASLPWQTTIIAEYVSTIEPLYTTLHYLGGTLCNNIQILPIICPFGQPEFYFNFNCSKH